MSQRTFGFLKNLLPPKASFALRLIKSRVVDQELQQLARFARFISAPNGAAIDVGANSGLYSRVLSSHFEQVFSIEPHPLCAEYMRSVLPRTCTVIEAAASDRDENTCLRVPVLKGGLETTRATISGSNQFDGLSISGTVEFDVQSRSLDSLISEGVIDGASVALVKIDVEGHELSVLAGARDLLSKWSPGLYIELESRHGTRLHELVEFISEIGYCILKPLGPGYVVDRRFETRGGREAALAEAASVNVIMLHTGSNLLSPRSARLTAL